MRTCVGFVAVAALLLSPAARAGDCEDGYSVENILDDGRLIRLDDGSLWQVATYDRTTAASWSPPIDEIICDGSRIITEDDNEGVDARKIR